MQNPLVSILIPFRDTEAFIEACLQSILTQTYAHWELIIIDDHSTDTSYNLVKTYAAHDSRIKLFKNTGRGIIDALQLAFKKSSGTLITRMDSDDVMRKNKLEVMVKHLQTHGTGHVALGLVNYFSDDGIKAGYKSYEVWLNTLTRNGSNYAEIYKECVIPSPCWMIHREDLVACDAFNPNTYPEDTLVVWGAGNKGKFIAKSLIEKNIDFEWICDNPKKIGKDIYGKLMKSFDCLETLEKPQSIITVANKAAQIEIRNYLNKLNMDAIDDYVFFC